MKRTIKFLTLSLILAGGADQATAMDVIAQDPLGTAAKGALKGVEQELVEVGTEVTTAAKGALKGIEEELVEVGTEVTTAVKSVITELKNEVTGHNNHGIPLTPTPAAAPGEPQVTYSAAK